MSHGNGPGFGLSTSEVKRRQILPKSLLVGLVAGLVASAFRLCLAFIEKTRLSYLGSESFVLWKAVGTVAIATLGGGLGVWLVRRFAPEAAGSGIPHLKSVVLGERTLNWRRVIPVKFLAGVAGIGGGLALGREGPTIQMGGGLGLFVGDILRVKPGEGERKALISAGAGAGLAAAFNAPLAGVVFVLEELQGSFTPVVFVAAFLASVVADVVARLLAGSSPVFALRMAEPAGLGILPLAAFLGALLGFVGVAFNRSLLASLDFAARFKKWPPFVVGACAGAFVGIVGVAFPTLIGSGGLIAEHALSGEMAIRWLPLLFLGRFALTLVSYGCGAAGGIFAPLLVLGALAGLFVGEVGHSFVPGAIPSPYLFAVLGMGALLASVVRAPLTGIVLMIELTGQYNIMLPLLTASLCAYGVAEYLQDPPIYEALRLRAQSLSNGQVVGQGSSVSAGDGK